MKCRGTDIRKKIVQEYYLKPEAHLKLLANQTIYSDAEATIKDEYYIFLLTRKKDGYQDIIKCGMGAARDFLKILGHKGLPLFNPLQEEPVNTRRVSSVSNDSNSDNNWNPIAKQLYNAIMLSIILLNLQPSTTIYKIRDTVVRYKNGLKFDGDIKGVNTIIMKMGKGKKLTEIINEYRKYNDFKRNICEFNLLEVCINKMNENGNKIESFF